eukprot:COSAG06_NODE_4325_length_4365_cov_2.112518_2_plen_65_part_00
MAILAVEEHLECEMATHPPCMSHGKAPRRYVARSEPSRIVRLMAAHSNLVLTGEHCHRAVRQRR